jgi:hypothetical protein
MNEKTITRDEFHAAALKVAKKKSESSSIKGLNPDVAGLLGRLDAAFINELEYELFGQREE